MKTILFALLAMAMVMGASACSSSARIGTRHHHIAFGGSIR